MEDGHSDNLVDHALQRYRQSQHTSLVPAGAICCLSYACIHSADPPRPTLDVANELQAQMCATFGDGSPLPVGLRSRSRQPTPDDAFAQQNSALRGGGTAGLVRRRRAPAPPQEPPCEIQPASPQATRSASPALPPPEVVPRSMSCLPPPHEGCNGGGTAHGAWTERRASTRNEVCRPGRATRSFPHSAPALGASYLPPPLPHLQRTRSHLPLRTPGGTSIARLAGPGPGCRRAGCDCGAPVRASRPH